MRRLARLHNPDSDFILNPQKPAIVDAPSERVLHLAGASRHA
jgi:hypothetical protein